jgi:Lon protease-like protein
VLHPLPLFPLGTVLFPGLGLPLHVFEQRYRRLVRDLLTAPKGAPRRFGVVAIREGREVGEDGVRALHEVGCAAEIREVESYDDGRYELLTTGTTRFRLHEVDRSRAYPLGQVEWLREDAGDADAASSAADSVRALFPRYVERLLDARGDAAPEPPRLPDDPLLLSYLVAAAMVLDLDDRQRLLEAPDAASRLVAERRLLRREAGVLRVLRAVPAVDLTRAAPSSN